MRVTPGDIDVYYYGHNSGITSLCVCIAISDKEYSRLQASSADVMLKIDIRGTLYIDNVKDTTRWGMLNGFIADSSRFRRLLA